VAEAAATVNYIFISHAKIQHVDALPFLHKIGVFAIPNLKDILATSPLQRLVPKQCMSLPFRRKSLKYSFSFL
jgi:Cft2 family RNA processing exonuclease